MDWARCVVGLGYWGYDGEIPLAQGAENTYWKVDQAGGLMPLPLLAGALIGPVAELAKGIMDKIWPPQADPNLKLQAQAVIEQAIQQRENALVTATQEIIVAEMAQGDFYTKRARPTLVYAGLFFILLVHVASPMVSWFTKQTLPAMTLPEEFWWAWGSVVGIWSLGRTFEKKGIGGAITNAIVGK